MRSKRDFKTLNFFLENYTSGNREFGIKHNKTDIFASYITNREIGYSDYGINFKEIVTNLIDYGTNLKEYVNLKVYVHKGELLNLKYIANYILEMYGSKVQIKFYKNNVRSVKVTFVRQFNNVKFRVHLTFLDIENIYFKLDYSDYYNVLGKKEFDFYNFYDKDDYFTSKQEFKDSPYFIVMKEHAEIMNEFFYNDLNGLRPYLKGSYNQSAYDMLEKFMKNRLRTKFFNIYNPDKLDSLKEYNREKTIEMWETLKKAELSGELYLDKEYQNKIVEKVHLYDVNSAFLDILKNGKVPQFIPVLDEKKDIIKEAFMKFYEVDIEIAETKFHPFIDSKDDFDLINLATKIIEAGGSYNNHLFERANKEKIIKDKKIVMDSFTYDYFKKNYKGKWTKKFMIGFVLFEGLLNNYADFLMEKKIEAEKAGNKFLRNLIKLMPAIAVGKTASTIYYKDLKMINGDDFSMSINHFNFSRGEQKVRNDYSYLPFNIAVISQQRIKMFDMWKEIEKDGTRKVIYIDTDSFHIVGEKLPEDWVNDYDLGKLKYQGTINKAVYKAKKVYLHVGKENDKDYYKLTAAGLISKFTNDTKSLSVETFSTDDFIIFNALLRKEIYPTGDIICLENYVHTKNEKLEKAGLDTNILNI